MDVAELKSYILDNHCVETILESIGCRYIHYHTSGRYWTCGNKDGDNPQAIVVYENDGLVTVNYTRVLSKHKRSTDLLDLICHHQDCTFPEALRFCCNLFGLDYYSQPEEKPESISIMDILEKMNRNESKEEMAPLKPIPERLLQTYIPCGNALFTADNIPLHVQQEYEVMFDPISNYIVIPIRDEIGTLVGVKGRYIEQTPPNGRCKYIYLEPCARGRLLYGYYQNQDYIKYDKYLYIVESEKAVMQAAAFGVRNIIATGSKNLSQAQIEMITRTGCTPVLALDQDVGKDELRHIASGFLDCINVMALYDSKHIMEAKQSPTDDVNVFKNLEMIKLRAG